MKTVTVAGGNLFALALEHLGDATQWNRIAQANGLIDPFVTGRELSPEAWERIWDDLVRLLPLGVRFSQILTMDDQVVEVARDPVAVLRDEQPGAVAQRLVAVEDQADLDGGDGDEVEHDAP